MNKPVLEVVPTFSVVIPLYNKRPYIRRAVESVLRQEFADFELIVVDDGSTDGSLDALVDITDKRLRVIRQENMGGAGGLARNTGMAHACGTWFAFLDGDDKWLPNHLEEIARITAHYPEPGMISPRPIEISDGQVVPRDTQVESNIRRIDYFLEASKSLGFNNCSSTAIHRSVFDSLGGFINARSGPDLEYWARVALHFPVTISDRVTSVYFRGTDGNMEQLARVRQKDSPALASLREASPSLAMLCNQAEENPQLWKNPSIRAYVNGRLENGMRGALYRGEVAHARKIVTFMMRPLTLKQRFYLIGLYFPEWFISGGIKTFRLVKAFKNG